MAFWNRNSTEKVDEQIAAFRKKGIDKTPAELSAEKGEGWEQLSMIPGVGNLALGSFNMFYDQYINRAHEHEYAKIMSYREMALYPEIADVIEDGTNEATQVDHDDRVINLQIMDSALMQNENILKNITKEFNNFFYQELDRFPEKLWDMFRTYLIDGRVYYERIINEKNQMEGIKSIKKLPSETMDFVYDPANGYIQAYFQYLKRGGTRPKTIEEATARDDVIMFNPSQIGYINYGIYGRNKYDVFGYLEKCRVPYNQLKLLEISVIIYRLIRAPERFVFRIDTGNMPRDKALKYVEKIKMKMAKKQTYNAQTGQLSMEPEVFCIRSNTEIPLLDGRYLTLKEIIEEYNNGKENWVYSVNQDTLNIEPGKITNAIITRKNENLIRIWVDDKNYIDTTYDHKYILRDGSECRADELTIGQSLMPLYKKNKIMGSNLEYEKIYNPGTKRWRWTHKMSIGDIKLNEIRHHKDYNRFNNNPTNLKIMDKDIHFEFHQKILKEKWINDYDGQVESIRNGVKKWHSEEKNQERHSKWVTKANIEQNKVEKMQAVLNTPEIRERQKQAACKAQTKRFSNPENKKYMKKIKSILFDNFLLNRFGYLFIENNRPKRDDLGKILTEDNIFISHLKKINEKQSFSNIQYNHINKQTIWKIIKKLGFENYPEFRSNYLLNHKVAKIEYLAEKDDTGCITVEGNHNFAVSKDSQPTVFISNSMLENYYLPQSSEGRGSQIETIGGNAAGFSELDDLYYFARKLYRALKYPMSRVENSNTGQSGDSLFGGNSTQEIPRDEIKWAKFLERQQNKFEYELTDLFLTHLDFKGLKKQYDLTKKKIKCNMVPPSNYKEQMEQAFLESRYNNYQALADRGEISKYYLMRKFLKWSEEDIQENIEGLKKDSKYGFVVDPAAGGY